MKLSITTLLVAAFFGFDHVNAQDCTTLTPFDTSGLGSFTSISTGRTCPSDGTYTGAPYITYAISEVDDPNVLITMTPPNVVTPKVVDGVLTFEYADSNWSTGQPAYVTLTYPTGTVQSVKTEGQGNTASFSFTSAVTVSASGQGNEVNVISSSAVTLEVSGQGCDVSVQAPTVDLTVSGQGVDVEVNGSVSGSVSGQGGSLLIQGTVTTLDASDAVGTDIEVNGDGCSNVDTSFLSSCSATTDTVTVEMEDCEVINGSPVLTTTCSGGSSSSSTSGGIVVGSADNETTDENSASMSSAPTAIWMGATVAGAAFFTVVAAFAL